MRGNTFVTTRGDQISRPHGRRPQHGRIRGPYPKINEVSEGIGIVGDPCLSLSEIVTAARASSEDPTINGFGHHNPQLGQEDDLFYNALAIDRFMEGFFRGRDLSTDETQFFQLMGMGILDGREGYDMPMTASTRATRHTAAVSTRLFVMYEHKRQQVCCLGMSDLSIIDKAALE